MSASEPAAPAVPGFAALGSPCADALASLCRACGACPRASVTVPERSPPGVSVRTGSSALVPGFARPSGFASPHTVRLRTGQLLYGAGQRGDALFVVQGGLVKETLGAEDGARVVRLVGLAGVTGLAAVLGEPHRHSAMVIGDGHACRIPVERVRALIRSDPAVALELASQWQKAIDDVDRLIRAFACGPARARLARYVLFLVDALGQAARLRRQEAADLIGVTAVSVTRLIGEFKREGLIAEVGARIGDYDRTRLMRLASAARSINPADPFSARARSR